MRKPRAPLPQVPSATLRVGDCVVDVVRREIAARGTGDARGQPMRVTLKAMHVLLVLVERQGQVVTRDALLDVVWQGTLPTDDVVTQAVAQLRKAFGDGHGAPRYIETIARVGYRLLAQAVWGDPTDLPAARVGRSDAEVGAAAPMQARPGAADAVDQADARQSAGSDIARSPTAPITQSGPDARDAIGPRASASRTQAEAPTADRGERDMGPHSQPFRPGVLAAVGLVVLAIALLAVHALQERTVRATARPIAAAPGRPRIEAPAVATFAAITSRPGRETMPNLSPDGALVAYVEAPADAPDATAIMVQATAQANPTRLTAPPAGAHDELPVWSRDGRRLAFVRVGPGERCELRLVAATGGAERKAGDCRGGSYSSYDWTPGDDGLVMGGTRGAGDTHAGLRILDLASGRWRDLAYPVAPGDVDLDPRYSPDGRWLGFRRHLSLSDLWRMPAGGGPLQRMTRLRSEIRGWDWLPDGNGLVLAHAAADGMLYRQDLRGGDAVPLGVSAPGTAPDVAARAPVLAFEIGRARSGLFRLAGDADAPVPVFASSGVDLMPAVSPDGRQLAFLSDRSAHTALWIGEVGAPGSLRQVEGLDPVPRHAPVWSRDGRALLVLGRLGARAGLFEVAADTGLVRRLPVPVALPMYAAYTDRRDRLLVGADDGDGRIRLGLYDTAATPWRRLATLDDVTLAKFDFARPGLYFTRAAQSGLFHADPALRRVAPAAADAPVSVVYRNWTLADGWLYIAGPTADCPLAIARWRSGRGADAHCLRRAARADPAMLFPSVDARGARYLDLPIDVAADIGWARLTGVGAAAARQAPASR